MTGPGSARHICWSYDDPAALEGYARRFLGEGLARGEQVWFVSTRRPAALMRWLDRAAAPGDGDAVRFVPLTEAYPTGQVIDPAAQVAAYTAATEQALAAGRTGLRVVADATSLVAGAGQLEAFARYEHLIDRYLTRAPMRATCVYDRSALAAPTIVALACMHPETNVGNVPFRLHADPGHPTATALAGELDVTTEELFPATLRRAQPRPVDGELVMAAGDLRFLDHRSMLHLQEYAEAHAATVVLRTGLRTAAHLADLLALRRVRVEAVR